MLVHLHIPRLYRFLKLQLILTLAYLSGTVPEVSKSNIKHKTLIRKVTGEDTDVERSQSKAEILKKKLG